MLNLFLIFVIIIITIIFQKLVDVPSSWKLFIVIVAIINVVVTFVYEKVVAIHMTLYWRKYQERKEKLKEIANR